MMEDSPLEGARRVFDALHRIMHVLTADVRSRAGELELTLHQSFAMQMLLLGPLSMAELAERLQVTRATATGFIDRLVQKDLMKRMEDPADRRIVLVELTERGRTLLMEFEHLIESRSVGVLTRLTPAELADLTAALELLESKLEADVPDRCPWPGAHRAGTRRTEATM